MPPTTFFEQLHSQWSQVDKASKLGWLAGGRMRINALVIQMVQYVHAREGIMNAEEREYARELMEMIQYVDAEGTRTVHELKNEAIKELVKALMKKKGSLSPCRER